MNYLTLNISLSVSSVILFFAFYLFNRGWLKITPKAFLRTSYILIILAFLSPVAANILPVREYTNPYIQIWTPTGENRLENIGSDEKKDIIMLQNNIMGNTNVSENIITKIFTALFIIGILIVLTKTLMSLIKINRIIKTGFVIKRIKSVVVLSSDNVPVPFSFLFFGKTFAVIPNSMLEKTSLYKTSLLHEFQHHRNKDTAAVYFMLLFKAVFFWNPFVHILLNIIAEIQELACDEALITQGRVTCRVYSESLYDLAFHNRTNKQIVLAGTAGMALFTSPKILTRRIKFMYSYRKGQSKKVYVALCAVLLLCSTISSVFASQGVITDRRITMEDAQGLYKNAREGSNFPLVLNESVLEQLNLFLGTQDGRKWIKDSVAKMTNISKSKESYKTIIENQIKASGLPGELIAIPFIESGFNNKPASSKYQSAGLWQFMPGTAKNYHLRVENNADDRLNAKLATKAALKYLEENNQRFNDWGLAIVAYNTGEKKLQEALNGSKSKDPWTVLPKEAAYLSKAYAAMIILKNLQSPLVMD